MTEYDRRIDLERADARQQAINDVLKEVNSLAGNEIYQRAWKKVSVRIRGMLSASETVNTAL